MRNDFSESGIEGYSINYLDKSDHRYINQFWLNAEALSSEWADVINASFTFNGGSVSIASSKEVDVRMGGLLFVEEEFREFQRRSADAGARRFVIIEDVGQDNWKRIFDRSFFRFSYPVIIDWQDMAAASNISNDIFFRPIRAYYVLTDNGKVGKYVNNDAARPYELVFS